MSSTGGAAAQPAPTRTAAPAPHPAAGTGTPRAGGLARPGARTPAPRPTKAAPAEKSRMSTPQWLRALLGLIAVISLLSGTVFGVGLWSEGNRTGAAVHDSEQLRRVQAIQTSLLSADAAATSGMIGQDSQQQAFRDRIREASALIVEASVAQPDDKAALAQLNGIMLDYAGQVQAAEAYAAGNNALGSGQMSAASSTLREQAIPVLDQLVNANQQRVTDATRSPSLLVLGLAVAANLVVITFAMIRIARHFRRVVNVGLILAALCSVLAFSAGAAAINNFSSTLTQVNQTSLATARWTAAARVHAYDAQASQNLALIEEGRAADLEQRWSTESAAARDALGQIPDPTVRQDLLNRWGAYENSHEQVRRLIQQGKVQEARTAATANSADAPGETFRAFDQAVSETMNSRAQEATNALGSAQPWLYGGAILGVAFSLTAIVFAASGINSRLREYA
ncbi:hypothetical protein [Granulicoccus phenolivorans]|uniref:hypothetical protein n=1 Tax=Granulicoccus phenolivorans TaxID=266854 RepID=UPI0003F8565E|nr:hypothetical protein [Granulicoccus phenolivorans]